MQISAGLYLDEFSRNSVIVTQFCDVPEKVVRIAAPRFDVAQISSQIGNLASSLKNGFV